MQEVEHTPSVDEKPGKHVVLQRVKSSIRSSIKSNTKALAVMHCWHAVIQRNEMNMKDRMVETKEMPRAGTGRFMNSLDRASDDTDLNALKWSEVPIIDCTLRRFCTHFCSLFAPHLRSFQTINTRNSPSEQYAFNKEYQRNTPSKQ